MLKIISWNLARRSECWRSLLNSGADIAVVQEACKPPLDVAERIGVDAEVPWATEGAGMVRSWRTAVVRLNPGLDVRWYSPHSIRDANLGDLAVSRIGTLAAAEVRHPQVSDSVTIVSMYSSWEEPHRSTESGWIYADASAHRLVSDLSTFIGQQRGHRVVAAGDLNILYGHGEDGSSYWAARYRSVFDRMAALGLPLVGPQFPNGRQAQPWPPELPNDSRNVPTFHSNRQTPETATRQLDFVFASVDLVPRVAVTALNSPKDWGPSDHCRIEIDVM